MWLINLSDRKPRLINESKLFVTNWSSDGQWIYGFERDSGQLCRVNTSTGQLEKLPQLTIDSEYQISSMDIAPDETTFVIQGTKTQSDIWIADDKN